MHAELTEADRRRIGKPFKMKDEKAVWDKYNAAWKNYHAIAEAAFEAEGPNLARILSHCFAVRGKHPVRRRRGYPPRMGGLPLSDAISPRSQQALYYSMVWENILSRIPEGTERIVEMGSGWGAMICGLWLSGAPKDAEYWALEYTKTGRDTADLLARAEPRLRLRSHAFDYHDADFSYLTEPVSTLVYSIYSIEQITFLKDELIERILAIPGFTRCVHVEPIGWQVDPNALEFRLDRLVKKVGLRAWTQRAASMRRCRRHGKNRNLMETLRRFEAAGKLAIESVQTDLVANDPLNPGTLVVWRKA